MMFKSRKRPILGERIWSRILEGGLLELQKYPKKVGLQSFKGKDLTEEMGAEEETGGKTAQIGRTWREKRDTHEVIKEKKGTSGKNGGK